MDIFSKIPFLKSDDTEQIAEDEAQAKAERIKFHRIHVRNGPTNFKDQTNGQVKRARVRALARETKRARRIQVRNHRRTQQYAATVRGQLQLAGALPYLDGRALDPVRQVKAVAWLVQRFGAEEIPNYRAEYVLNSLRSALGFYSKTVGLPGLALPEDYVLPIYEIEQPA